MKKILILLIIVLFSNTIIVNKVIQKIVKKDFSSKIKYQKVKVISKSDVDKLYKKEVK